MEHFSPPTASSWFMSLIYCLEQRSLDRGHRRLPEPPDNNTMYKIFCPPFRDACDGKSFFKTRSRSVENAADTKLDNTSLSAGVFQRVFQKGLPSLAVSRKVVRKTLLLRLLLVISVLRAWGCLKSPRRRGGFRLLVRFCISSRGFLVC